MELIKEAKTKDKYKGRVCKRLGWVYLSIALATKLGFKNPFSPYKYVQKYI
jgi:hypothetical protein